MYFRQYSQIHSLLCLPYSSGYGLKYHVSISNLPICILSMYLTFVICSCSFSKAAVVGSISAYLEVKERLAATGDALQDKSTTNMEVCVCKSAYISKNILYKENIGIKNGSCLIQTTTLLSIALPIEKKKVTATFPVSLICLWGKQGL